MVKYENVIKSELPPHGSSLWIDRENTLRIFIGGEWQPLCVFNNDEEVEAFIGPILERINSIEESVNEIDSIDLNFIVALS